jgi:hypothetical protein
MKQNPRGGTKMSFSKTLANRSIMLIMLVIGYEMLMSGLSKVFGGFVTGFHHELSTSITDAFGFYHPILKGIVLPNSVLFATGATLTELFVGISFILIPILGSRSFSSGLAKWGLVTSVIAAFYNLTLFLYSGDPFFVNPSAPYEESVSIDLLLALMELVLFYHFYQAIRWIKEETNNEEPKIVHSAIQ